MSKGKKHLGRTLSDAMYAAKKLELELPEIVQVAPGDWDTVILANEVLRLRKVLDSLLQQPRVHL